MEALATQPLVLRAVNSTDPRVRCYGTQLPDVTKFIRGHRENAAQTDTGSLYIAPVSLISGDFDVRHSLSRTNQELDTAIAQLLANHYQRDVVLWSSEELVRPAPRTTQ